MTDHELLLAIYNDVKSMKEEIGTVQSDVKSMKNEIGTVQSDVGSMKDELEIVKKDVKHLKKEAIKMQAMDEAILDEVERVHGILDKHKEDKTVHTA